MGDMSGKKNPVLKGDDPLSEVRGKKPEHPPTGCKGPDDARSKEAKHGQGASK